MLTAHADEIADRRQRNDNIFNLQYCSELIISSSQYEWHRAADAHIRAIWWRGLRQTVVLSYWQVL